MERYCSTGQSPQQAVAPTEEEEEEEEEEEVVFFLPCFMEKFVKYSPAFLFNILHYFTF